MPQCKCGSWAINHHTHGRDGSDGDLCDVCYWRKRAERIKAIDEADSAAIAELIAADQELDLAHKKFQEEQIRGSGLRRSTCSKLNTAWARRAAALAAVTEHKEER